VSLARGPSTVDVAAPTPAVRLGLELPLKLHKAPDPGAVGADVGLLCPTGGRLHPEQGATWEMTIASRLA
jgi:hypothetical protein